MASTPADEPAKVSVAARSGGLLAPRAFLCRTGEEIRRALRYGRPLSLALMALDGMHGLREGLGEELIDQHFDRVSRAINRRLRESDYLGRHEGEAFAMLLVETPGARAAKVAERVMDDIRAMPWGDGVGIEHLSASVGITCLNPRLTDPDAMLRSADIALCQAQRQGGDCIVVDEAVKLNPTVQNNGRVH